MGPEPEKHEVGVQAAKGSRVGVDPLVSTEIDMKFEDVVAVRNRMTDDEYRIRKMLAFAYENKSGGLIYGDDGELQLQVHNPFVFIDFMRDTVAEIEDKISDIGFYRYAQSLKETEC